MSVTRPLLVSSRGILERITRLVVDTLSSNPIISSVNVTAKSFKADQTIKSDNIMVSSVPVASMQQFTATYIASYAKFNFYPISSANGQLGSTGSRVIFSDDTNPADGAASLVWPGGTTGWNPSGAAFEEVRNQIAPQSPFVIDELRIPSTSIYRIHARLCGYRVDTAGNTAMSVVIGGVVRGWAVAKSVLTMALDNNACFNLNIIAHCTLNDTVQVRLHTPRNATTTDVDIALTTVWFDFSIERIGNEFTSAG